VKYIWITIPRNREISGIGGVEDDAAARFLAPVPP